MAGGTAAGYFPLDTPALLVTVGSVVMRGIDRTGQRWGRLVVMERQGSSAQAKALWKCRCDCGNIITVNSNNLQSGNTASCGCLKKEYYERDPVIRQPPGKLINLRRAGETDVPAILKIARQFPRELGWVRKTSLQRSFLIIADYGEEKNVGFVAYSPRRDGWNVISALAVSPAYQRCGVGRFLVQAVPCPTRLKCVAGSPANDFYKRQGFALVGTEQGRKQLLNKWQRWMLVVLCKGSSEIVKDIPALTGMAYGTRHTESPLRQPYMVDIRWTDYDWQDYLYKLKLWKPVFALAPDLISPDQRRFLYQQIRQMKEAGVLRIGVCPKYKGAVQHIPSWCVVAVSLPSKYAGYLPDPEELAGRSLHLLGGTPQKQLAYVQEHPSLKVISVDGNSFTKLSFLGFSYSANTNQWVQHPLGSTTQEERLLLSAQNIMKAWQHGY